MLNLLLQKTHFTPCIGRFRLQRFQVRVQRGQDPGHGGQAARDAARREREGVQAGGSWRQQGRKEKKVSRHYLEGRVEYSNMNCVREQFYKDLQRLSCPG